MIRIDIKPLSVNEAWQGKRFKTNKYKDYEKLLLLKLKPLTIPDGDLEVRYTFGFSNRSSDIDNPIKAFQDILQKKYGFNDSKIYRLVVNKVIVPKGEEFIEFEIKNYNNQQ